MLHMIDLKNVKMYGGIGALLLLFGGVVPYVGSILNLVGLILVFIAVKSFSDLVKEEEIFKNYLMSFIFTIIALVALFAILLIGFGAAGGFSWLSSLDTTNITDFSSFLDQFGEILIAGIIGLLVAWVFGIIGAWYLRKSYKRIAYHTKVKHFETAGSLYFYGMISAIILVGFLLIFIGRILEIAAYFSLPDTLGTDSPAQTPTQSTRRCVNCGRVIPEDAHVCPYCAKAFDEETR